MLTAEEWSYEFASVYSFYTIQILYNEYLLLLKSTEKVINFWLFGEGSLNINHVACSCYLVL